MKAWDKFLTKSIAALMIAVFCAGGIALFLWLVTVIINLWSVIL